MVDFRIQDWLLSFHEKDNANKGANSNEFFFEIFSLPVDELGKYPAWMIIYVCQVILPMIGLAVIALKIELKFGKEVRREIFWT